MGKGKKRRDEPSSSEELDDEDDMMVSHQSGPGPWRRDRRRRPAISKTRAANPPPRPQGDDDLVGDDEDGSEGEDAEARQQPGAGPSGRTFRRGEPAGRRAIYNVEAIHDKLEDIGWTDEAAWEETQAFTHGDGTQVANIDDDLARELAFYNQVSQGALHGHRSRTVCLQRRRGEASARARTPNLLYCVPSFPCMCTMHAQCMLPPRPFSSACTLQIP